MKHALASTALSIPLLVAFAAPADLVLAYRPAEGLSLRKDFVFVIESELDDMEMWIDGNEQEAPPIENFTTLTSEVTVLDRYLARSEARPTELRRTFEAISGRNDMELMHPMAGEQDMELSAESDLEGLTVVFTWSEDDEEYEVAFAEEDADEDEELLADLEFDMDLGSFMPGRAVGEGDSWQIDPEALAALLAPGGNLKLATTDELPGGMDMPNQFDLGSHLGLVEGSITARHEGVRNVGGRRVGVIALEIETESSSDITDLLIQATEAAAESGANAGYEQDIESADVQSEYDLSGEMLWDLDGGHLTSLEISGDTESVMDLAATVRAMGSEFEAEQAMYMSGSVSITIEFTRAGGEE